MPRDGVVEEGRDQITVTLNVILGNLEIMLINRGYSQQRNIVERWGEP